jgi:ABC-2 type transport system ATP-binding protein
LCGIIEPDAGDIVIGGHSLRSEPMLAKAQLGYAPDGAGALPDLLVSEFIALVRALKSLPVAPAAGELSWRERLGVLELWHQRIRSLSFGQQKRVAIVAALAGSPRVLLLDEPTNGLDTTAVANVVELIEERRRAERVHVIATNDIELVERVGGSRLLLAAGRAMPPVV